VFNTNFSGISAINSKKKNAKIKNKIKKNAKIYKNTTKIMFLKSKS
jgi:hypothetical protein